MYVTCDAFPTAIATIPKAGSQSIAQAVLCMRNGQTITNEQALPIEERVLFLRNPKDRLNSAYSFLWWLTYNGQDVSEFIPKGTFSGEFGTEKQDYKNFIDYVLANKNNHWSSQIDQVTHNGVFTPTKVFKFEEIKLYWDSVARGAIPSRETDGNNFPWLNAWTKKPECVTFKAYRKDEIIVEFGPDMDLWNTL